MIRERPCLELIVGGKTQQAAYPVAEIFASVQGEGSLTGMPAAFVRLQGCKNQCPWCDTPFSQEQGKGSIMSCDKIWGEVEPLLGANRMVVVTGGEPGLYNLARLVRRLLSEKCFVVIETSGTDEGTLAAPPCWLIVSPKIEAMKRRGVKAHESFQKHLEVCNELKMVVTSKKDLEWLHSLVVAVAARRSETRIKMPLISLQPVWLEPTGGHPCGPRRDILEMCIKEARVKGAMVSLQIHKRVGLR